LASPAPNSIAARAGLSGKEHVLSLRVADGGPTEIGSMEALRWQLLRSALSREVLSIEFTRDGSSKVEFATLDMTALDVREVDAALMRKVGILGPYTEPVLSEISTGGAAERAGLLAQDRVMEVDGVAMVDGAQLREAIRAYALQGQGRPQRWLVERAGKRIDIAVVPDVVKANDSSVGRVGAAVGSAPQMLLVQRGLLDGLGHGLERTIEVSAMTLRMMGRMLIGQASLRNLSGPLTIADYAGKSASFGLVPYLIFLALISVSLGVLNLLPLPVLDGGHLMYYLWEWLTGKTITDAWLERLQRGGVALLFLMMSVALYNDVTRLLWG
jgi:regulator of sigma E protease